MKLETLLRQVETKSVIGRLDREVFGIESDHRKLNAGFAWICYKGVKIDAHQFIPSALAAISNRPTAIIAEATATGVPGNLTYVQVANGRSALAQIAANWYCRPAEDLDLIDNYHKRQAKIYRFKSSRNDGRFESGLDGFQVNLVM